MYRPDNEPYMYSSGIRQKRTSALGEIGSEVNWLLFVGFFAVLVFSLYATDLPGYVGIATFVFVLVGWLFSLTLHEFSHAATAFLCGDRSYTTRRYLSGNPLHYINPLLSIVLPLLFTLIGGIGLPGGAVLLNMGSVYKRWQRAAISLAGPAANLVVLLALAVLYQIGPRFGFLGEGAIGAIVFLGFLQLTAIVINLIPIPGLDGYGAIEPYLSYETRQSFEMIRPYGFIIIFALFFLIPAVGSFVFGTVAQGLALVGMDPGWIGMGWANFRFWLR